MRDLPPQTINFEPLVSWLEGKAYNVYTQFGEDGLLAEAFKQIRETNRQCFEVGAADGVFYSNTLRLREQGWKALLIEANEAQFRKLEAEFGHESNCLHAICTDLDLHLDSCGFDRRPDLGVIDIDGQDYHLWNRMVRFKPRVMLVEISGGQPDDPIPEPGSNQQAGLKYIRELGEAKGYELIATTFCNALFICP